MVELLAMMRDARALGRDDLASELLAELDIDFAPPRTDSFWGIRRGMARRSLRGRMERWRRENHNAVNELAEIIRARKIVYMSSPIRPRFSVVRKHLYDRLVA